MGDPLGSAARQLAALADADPLFFSSFYRRARFFAESPKPASAAVTLDVTTECPLRCDFCFAAGTQGAQRTLAPAQLAELEGELRGVPKVTLVGGEPLAHPQLGALLGLLRPHHRRLEIYTSGQAIPRDKAKRGEWMADRFGAWQGHATLTIAADRFHREQLGAARFREMIENALAAEREQWPVAVRFNVTDSALHTAGYLEPGQVESVLGELHEALVPAFRQALRGGAVDDHFQFNPLVQLGRGQAWQGELLQAEDSIFAPEFVVAPPHDGGFRVVSFLPATWLGELPEALQLGGGTASAALNAGARELVRRRLVACGLAEPPADWLQNSDADPDRQFRLLSQLARTAADWQQLRPQWQQRMAQQLFDITSHSPCGWQLGAGRRVRRLTAPVLRELWLLHQQAGQPRAGQLLSELAQLACEAVAGGRVPMFTGYQPQAGLLTDAPDEPLPLQRAPLDLGPDAPHMGDALLHPRVVATAHATPDGLPHVRFDGAGSVPVADAESPELARESVAHWLAMVEYFVADDHLATFRALVAGRLAAQSEPAAAFAMDALAAERAVIARPPNDDSPAQALKHLCGEAHAHFRREIENRGLWPA